MSFVFFCIFFFYLFWVALGGCIVGFRFSFVGWGLEFIYSQCFVVFLFIAFGFHWGYCYFLGFVIYPKSLPKTSYDLRTLSLFFSPGYWLVLATVLLTLSLSTLIFVLVVRFYTQSSYGNDYLGVVSR